MHHFIWINTFQFLLQVSQTCSWVPVWRANQAKLIKAEIKTAVVFVFIQRHALMSGGKVSQHTAGKSSKKRVPDMLEGEEPGLSLNREGWMSLWKNRQKKWSRRGAFSTSQKALQRKREILLLFIFSVVVVVVVSSFGASLLQGLVQCWAWMTVYEPEF